MQRLGEGSVDVVQELEVAISLCLRITAARTIHRRPFYRRVGGVHAYPLLEALQANHRGKWYIHISHNIALAFDHIAIIRLTKTS